MSDDFVDRLRVLIGKESVRSFAHRAGLKSSTLQAVLKGSNPTLPTLIAIAEAGSVPVGWLAVGENVGEAEPAFASTHNVDPAVLRLIARTVRDAHQTEGVSLPPDALIEETATAYNELMTRAEDPADHEELESLLPWLEARLRKRLKAARTEPGTGKRLA